MKESATKDSNRHLKSRNDYSDRMVSCLSDYERLRLRNIQRNEARLAMLGLLVSAGDKKCTTSIENEPGNLTISRVRTNRIASNKEQGENSTFTNPFNIASLGAARGAESCRDDPFQPKSTQLVSRNSLKRRAKVKKLQDSISYSGTNSKVTMNIFKTHPCTTGNGGALSLPSTPIIPTRIVKPQSHQKDFFYKGKKKYLKRRRNRRGRPKKEEYVHFCEEVCGYCGGSWGSIIFSKKKLADENNADYVAIRNAESYDCNSFNTMSTHCCNDQVKLLRCKDCRRAFHPLCMLLRDEVQYGRNVMPVSSELIQDDPTFTITSLREVSTDNSIIQDLTTERIPNFDNESFSCRFGFKANGYATCVEYETTPSNMCDLKRCLKCKIKKKSSEKLTVDNERTFQDMGVNNSLMCKPRRNSYLLDAIIASKIVVCKVTPKPTLEAVIVEKEIACLVKVGQCHLPCFGLKSKRKTSIRLSSNKKRQPQASSDEKQTQCPLRLDAMIGGTTFLCRVKPEVLLKAVSAKKRIKCVIKLGDFHSREL